MGKKTKQQEKEKRKEGRKGRKERKIEDERARDGELRVPPLPPRVDVHVTLRMQEIYFDIFALSGFAGSTANTRLML